MAYEGTVKASKEAYDASTLARKNAASAETMAEKARRESEVWRLLFEIQDAAHGSGQERSENICEVEEECVEVCD